MAPTQRLPDPLSLAGWRHCSVDTWSPHRYAVHSLELSDCQQVTVQQSASHRGVGRRAARPQESIQIDASTLQYSTAHTQYDCDSCAHSNAPAVLFPGCWPADVIKHHWTIVQQVVLL
jgi:hypothetical protein